MKRKKLQTLSPTIQEVFEDFIIAKRAIGLTEETIHTYTYHIKRISQFLSFDKPIDELTQRDIDNLIADMRDAGISSNTINSYTRTLKSFLSYCNQKELTTVTVKLYKTQETIKEPYTDAELKILLKKPNLKKCDFTEYRNWVIINLLVSTGCRAATIRNMLIQDVNFSSNMITYRHTKNKSVQIVPLCTEMAAILKEYLKIRGGEEKEYLFPTQYGEQITERSLGSSIASYNKSRGITKTSTHLFRHTFARKYLVDCGGNAFTLQKLLGHSTLDMTKHYCAIYNQDITKNFDEMCPLTQLNKRKEKKF